MKSIEYPNSGISASQVALGCMSFGGDWVAEQEVTKDLKDQALHAVEAALAADIDFFDTADIYKNGRSDLAFAHALKELKVDRSKIIIQSKCGIRREYGNKNFWGQPTTWYDFSYKNIVQSVNESLIRLETDYLDILLLHRPDVLADFDEVAKAMDELMAAGKIRGVGVSNFPASLIEAYSSRLNQMIVANQMELSLTNTSMLDSYFMTSQRKCEPAITNAGVLEYHQAHGIVTQAWSPHSQGLFTGASLEGQPEHVVRTAKLVREMADKYSTSPEAIVTAWVLKHPANTQVIIGTSNPTRIKNSTGGVDVELEKRDWYSLFSSARNRPFF